MPAPHFQEEKAGVLACGGRPAGAFHFGWQYQFYAAQTCGSVPVPFVGNGATALFHALCCGLTTSKSFENQDNAFAVDWLLEEFALRFGINRDFAKMHQPGLKSTLRLRQGRLEPSFSDIFGVLHRVALKV